MVTGCASPPQPLPPGARRVAASRSTCAGGAVRRPRLPAQPEAGRRRRSSRRASEAPRRRPARVGQQPAASATGACGQGGTDHASAWIPVRRRRRQAAGSPARRSRSGREVGEVAYAVDRLGRAARTRAPGRRERVVAGREVLDVPVVARHDERVLRPEPAEQRAEEARRGARGRPRRAPSSARGRPRRVSKNSNRVRSCARASRSRTSAASSGIRSGSVGAVAPRAPPGDVVR